jgi:hypothetical protein
MLFDCFDTAFADIVHYRLFSLIHSEASRIGRSHLFQFVGYLGSDVEVDPEPPAVAHSVLGDK